MNIKKIEIKKLYGYLDKDIEFKHGKNFLIGINGSGKTSILRIIISLITGDISYFENLDFEEILITIGRTSSSSDVLFLRNPKLSELNFKIFKDEENLVINSKEYTDLILKLAIFNLEDKIRKNDPNKEELTKELELYKSVKETIAINLINEKQYKNLLEQQNIITFGIEPYNLEKNILDIIKLRIEKNEKDMEAFNNMIYSIQPILKAKKNLENIGKEYLEKTSLNFEISKLEEKKKMLQDINSKLPKEQQQNYINEIFDIDQEIINYEVLKNNMSDKKIYKFIEYVNLFYLDSSKELKFNPIKGEFYVSILDINRKEVKKLDNICLLSSGEQQLLCLLIDVFFNIKNGTTIIIDEPEKSMHIEWQCNFMKILDYLLEENKNCQIIMATHSLDLINDEARESLIGLYPYNLKELKDESNRVHR